MPRFPPDEPGREPLRGYRLVRRIALGSFGALWAADDPAGRRVTLKILDLDDRLLIRAGREFALVSRLDHPHLAVPLAAKVVDCHGREADVGSIPDAAIHGVLSRLVVVWDGTGVPLSARLKELNPDGTRPESRHGVPVRELIPYMEGAAEGIDFLNAATHGLGAGDGPIIHCDIKPDNLLLRDGRVLLSDCGLAAVLTADPLRRGQVSGTMAYNPPELMGNRPAVGTDQYSLAVSYFELRTGRFPFPEDVMVWELMTIHAQGRLDFTHAALTDGEVQALRRATAVRPQDRFESCRAFVRALKRAVIDPLDDMEVAVP